MSDEAKDTDHGLASGGDRRSNSTLACRAQRIPVSFVIVQRIGGRLRSREKERELPEDWVTVALKFYFGIHCSATKKRVSLCASGVASSELQMMKRKRVSEASVPKAFLLIAFCMLASGCISDAERAETSVESDHVACVSSGEKPGSPGYLQCRMLKDRQRQTIDAALAGINLSHPQPQPYSALAPQ